MQSLVLQSKLSRIFQTQPTRQKLYLSVSYMLGQFLHFLSLHFLTPKFGLVEVNLEWVKIERRLGGSLLLLINLTWSKITLSVGLAFRRDIQL